MLYDKPFVFYAHNLCPHASSHLSIFLFSCFKVLKLLEHISRMVNFYRISYQLTPRWMHSCLDSRESEEWSGYGTTRLLFSAMASLNRLNVNGWCNQKLTSYVCSLISIMGRHDCCGWSWSSFSMRWSKNPSSVRQIRLNVRGNLLTYNLARNTTYLAQLNWVS